MWPDGGPTTMNAFLPMLPPILLAQALGVGLAWGVEALSWKWRRGGKNLFAFNLVLLAGLLPRILVLRALIWLLVVTLFWLIGVAKVQSRGFGVTYRAAFLGALVQLSCFYVALAGWVWLVIIRLRSHNDGLNSLAFGSAALSFALLSLFRPTIYGAWQAWKKNSSGAS